MICGMNTCRKLVTVSGALFGANNSSSWKNPFGTFGRILGTPEGPGVGPRAVSGTCMVLTCAWAHPPRSRSHREQICQHPLQISPPREAYRRSWTPCFSISTVFGEECTALVSLLDHELLEHKGGEAQTPGTRPVE